MKNTIVYGPIRTGKTQNYFMPAIKEWKGKTIAISFGEMIEGFRDFRLDSPELSMKDIFGYDKILLIANAECNNYFNNNGINKVIKYLLEKAPINEPILLAIDEFEQYNLSDKVNGYESILLKLLQNDKINTLLILHSLGDIKDKYPKEYKNIIKLSNLISTKSYEEYSGEFRVRFPKSLHKYLSEEALNEGVSLNSYIVYQLTKCMRQTKDEYLFLE